jgi:putative MATE family efflux protein
MRVALPIALTGLIGSSLSVVDNFMVGSLGETAVAAVGAGIQPFFVFWMIMVGFTSGCATFMAQFWGKEDVKNIKKTLGFAILASSSIGIIFFIIGMFFPEIFANIYASDPEVRTLAIEYIRAGSFCFLFLSITIPIVFCLRSIQQTRLPLFTSVFAFSMSTFLNYVFIFGNLGAPELGVMGAALSTSIARFLELILVLSIVFFRKNIIAGKMKEYFGWTKEFAKRVLYNAIPASTNQALWGLGMTMYIAVFARVGITAHAAVQLSNAVSHLFILAALSIGDAALILVGQRLGAGEREYGYELAKKLLKIGAIGGLVSGALLVVLSNPIISIFGELTLQGQRYMSYILIIYGAKMLITIVNGININGVLRSGGDTRYAMVVDSLAVWAIGVPIAIITTRFLRLPIYICVLFVRAEELVKFFILLNRFRSKKWLNNVITSL